MNMSINKQMDKPRLLVFGVDLKITPDNNPVVIEVNGHHTGIDGFLSLPQHSDFDECRKRVKKKLFDLYYGNLFEEIRSGKFINAQQKLKNEMKGICLEERVKRFSHSDQTVFYNLVVSESERILSEIEEKNHAFRNIRNAFRNFFNNNFLLFDQLTFNELKLLLGIETIINDEDLGLIVNLSNDFPSVLYSLSGFTMDFRNEIRLSFLRQLFEKFSVQKKKVFLSVSERNYVISSKHEKVFFEDIVFTPNNPSYVEEVAFDKHKQKAFLKESNKAPFLLWNGNIQEIKDFIDSLKRLKPKNVDLDSFPYLVIKPINGSRGKGINFFHIQDIIEIENYLSSKSTGKFLIEAFVPSKQIHLNGNEFANDGCMRYLLDVLCVSQGVRLKIEPLFERAYYRVANPLNQNEDLTKEEKFCLNLSKGAMPVFCSDNDINLVRPVVHDLVKSIIVGEKIH